MDTTVTVLHSTQPHHHHHHHHPRPFCTSSFPHTRTPGGRVSTAMTLGTSAVCSCITRTSGIGIGRLRVRIPAGAAGIFLFQSLTFSSRVKLSVLFLILCPFYTVLPQWYVKDSGHCAKNAGGRIHPRTHTPLTQRNRGGADYAVRA